MHRRSTISSLALLGFWSILAACSSKANDSGQTCTYNGKTYPSNVAWPSADGCHECWCLGDRAVCDAGPPCDAGVPSVEMCTYDGKSYPLGAIFSSTDGCNTCECLWRYAYHDPACTLNQCSGSPVVDALPPADICVYGGQTYPLGVYFSSADGCNQCHCRADGQVTCTFTQRGCPRDTGTADVQSDGLANPTRPEGGASVDGAVSSACSQCGPDELCVAYYDGLCHPMSSRCNQVSAATRASILVDHEPCFAKPIGDEICGVRDAGILVGCGAPSCGKDKETLVSDINCYGP